MNCKKTKLEKCFYCSKDILSAFSNFSYQSYNECILTLIHLTIRKYDEDSKSYNIVKYFKDNILHKRYIKHIEYILINYYPHRLSLFNKILLLK